MGAIAELCRAFGPEYLTRFPHLPLAHRQALDAISACRSGDLGSTLYRCTDPACGHSHFVHRSCGNRHCPQCQNHKTRAWLAAQLDRKLPGPHFLITFTVPEPLREVLRRHPRVGYEALFAASSKALKTLARDPRLLGSDLPGFTGVLHTWGRALPFHPHVHYLVPGGALSPDRSRWLPARPHFFLPVRALSPIYRALFREAMRREGLLPDIDPSVWHTDWVVHCEPAGDGANALKYLARYVFRVAISDHRVVAVSPGERTVTFRYQPRDAKGHRTMTLDVFEFLRRFLQHVLPTGFVKVRHFGFLHPNCAVPLAETRRLVTEATGATLAPEESPLAPDRPLLYCADCGAALVLVRRFFPAFPPRLLDTG